MKKLLVLFCFLLLLAACDDDVAQTIETDLSGTWTGTMIVEGMTENIRLDLSQQGSAVTGEMAYRDPETQTYETFGEVSGSVADSSARLNIASVIPGFPAITFTGEIEGNSYAGDVLFVEGDNNTEGTFELTK